MKWPEAPLGRVCRVIPGFAFKSADFCDDGIPVVKIASIQDNYQVDFTDAQCWPLQLFSERLEKFLLKDKDIVVAMTGATAGKLGRVKTEQDLLLNQRVAKIQAVDADPDFIWCALSSRRYREKFFGIASGAAQPNMSGAQIEAVEIPLPPLGEQRQIAGVLTAYDDLMENNRRRMALLEDSVRQLYAEWFVRLRYPNHGRTRRPDTLPKGWTRRPLEEICAEVPKENDAEHRHAVFARSELRVRTQLIRRLPKVGLKLLDVLKVVSGHSGGALRLRARGAAGDEMSHGGASRKLKACVLPGHGLQSVR